LSAVVSLGGNFTGLHLGCCNHVDSLPLSPEDKAGAGHVAAAGARRNMERLAAIGP
jgi:hypothetical protein